MGAISFHHFPLAPNDTTWDAAKEVASANVDDLKIMCTWVEDGQEDKKGAYKLPHHLAASHKTVRSGVIAAGNALMGSRGGVHGIPKDELPGVKAHLEKHYHEFGLKAPWEEKAFRPIKTNYICDLEIKDVNTASRTVSGYFAAFGNVDSDGDVFQKGAFAKSLIENKERIMHLLQHNVTQPIGRPTVLKEDDTGLYFETPIAYTELGDDVLTMYKDGIYNEHSVGFEMIKSEPDQDGKYPTVQSRWNPGQENPANVITEAKLWEGSTVTWGANQNTPFMGMKELERAFKQKAILQKALHTGELTDETYIKLEYQLNLILTALQHADAQKPDKSTSAAKGSEDVLEQLKKIKTILTT